MLDYLNDHKIENLESIIFDRGPIQEELGIAMRNVSGEWFLLLAGGKNILEFTYKKGHVIPGNLKNVKIGIMVETKAIYLCNYYKDKIIKGNPSFKINDITENLHSINT